MTRTTRPACRGNAQDGKEDCAARPDHIVVFLVNESRLPGQGSQCEHFACFRHLHSVIKFAESVGAFATVSAYKGI